jgi:hypothetical protein
MTITVAVAISRSVLSSALVVATAIGAHGGY